MTWAVGDTHTYHITDDDASGKLIRAYNRTRTVLADNVTVAGVPTYMTLSVYENETAGSYQNYTKDGLNTINKTGFVSEWYRFPLWAGNAWSYESHSDINGVALTARYDVNVIGPEVVDVPACPACPSWKLHVDSRTTYGAFVKEDHVDYWFAAAARDTIKTFELRPDGSTETWELTSADLH
jgi:hypothetical protein